MSFDYFVGFWELGLGIGGVHWGAGGKWMGAKRIKSEGERGGRDKREGVKWQGEREKRKKERERERGGGG